MRERLAAERDKHQARHRALAALSSKVNQWLVELRLPAGTALEVAPPVTIVPKSGEKLLDTVERLRTEIIQLRAQLDVIKRSPLPKAAQRDLIAAHVARMALAAKPSVTVVNDAVRISWREDLGVTAILAWVMPDELIDALADALPERPGAMSAEERNSAVSRLQDQHDAMEMQEAALLEYAHANGIEILPRIDMSPPAFLQVTVAQARAQVA
jgi:hypothetical protein